MISINIVGEVDSTLIESILELDRRITINSSNIDPNFIIVYEKFDEYYTFLKEFIGKIPIVIITGNTSYSRKCYFYSLGIDLYIIKNNEIKSVILCRILNEIKKYIKYVNDDFIDFENHQFVFNNYLVNLSNIELKILRYLYINLGRYVSKEELKKGVWDTEDFVDSNTINVYIHRLRDSLKDCREIEIINERKLGYKILIRKDLC
ncbi:response regulator receiver domain/transcriptional regulatory protein [Staphylococcus epidermidis]|uniref:winged helix-turn-helix domain-containing protein n=2 Tax=Staphylococcus epidermidis TaxID=1282 RepID=UPI000D1C27BC|nr:winged helix-turn-helix domain-containing protein [Staphylococcus epidermidis]PTE90460.1 winged helix family transcriptional regulator [Staphylococcus epidermidis]PTE96777.1 winged helix family transcriptional regulator [Staphylococcus epidermidis]PTF47105.1 winged helix family transcriptional regulator [Staphylococcus epidermidis]SUM53590.1 response regulator receiver domain/transcriptional regulatory protein [Staphylococcus epidermidis]